MVSTNNETVLRFCLNLQFLNFFFNFSELNDLFMATKLFQVLQKVTSKNSTDQKMALVFLFLQNWETFIKFCTCQNVWSNCHIFRDYLLLVDTKSLSRLKRVSMSVLNCIIIGRQGKSFKNFKNYFLSLVSLFLFLIFWDCLFGWNCSFNLLVSFISSYFSFICFNCISGLVLLCFLIHRLHRWFLRPLIFPILVTSTALQLKPLVNCVTCLTSKNDFWTHSMNLKFYEHLLVKYNSLHLCSAERKSPNSWVLESWAFDLEY